MVTVNVDIHNMLNGQVGEVSGFKIIRSIVKVSDPLIGRNVV